MAMAAKMATRDQGCKRREAALLVDLLGGADHPHEGERPMTRLIGGFLKVFCLSLLAMGQPLDCRQFCHNEDGSWTSISQLTVTSSPYGGQIYVGPRVFAGPDLAKRLNQQCLTKRKIPRPQ